MIVSPAGSGELVKSELARVTKAVAIDNLTSIAISLSVIKKDLWEIKNTTLQLQDQTSNLQSGELAMLLLLFWFWLHHHGSLVFASHLSGYSLVAIKI